MFIPIKEAIEAVNNLAGAIAALADAIERHRIESEVERDASDLHDSTVEKLRAEQEDLVAAIAERDNFIGQLQDQLQTADADSRAAVARLISERDKIKAAKEASLLEANRMLKAKDAEIRKLQKEAEGDLHA